MIGVVCLGREPSVDDIAGLLEEVDRVRVVRTLMGVASAGCHLLVVVDPVVDRKRAARITELVTAGKRRETPLAWVTDTSDSVNLYQLSGLPVARVVSDSLSPDTLRRIVLSLRTRETVRDPVLEVIGSRVVSQAALGRGLALAASCVPPFSAITQLGAAVKTGPSALRKQWSAMASGRLRLKTVLNRIQLARLRQLVVWGHSIDAAVAVCRIHRSTADGIARRLAGTTLAHLDRDPDELWDELADLLANHLVSA